MSCSSPAKRVVPFFEVRLVDRDDHHPASASLRGPDHVDAGRCLIGDEMGLGKTIQALTAAEIMARRLGVERVLVVCPTSLKHQWEREIARFTDRRATVVGGLRGRREQHYAVADRFFKMTNYDTVHSDLR